MLLDYPAGGPRWTVLLAGLVLAGCHQLPASAGGSALRTGPRMATPAGPAPPAGCTRLDNGLRVALQESHLAHVVALQLWIDAGTADEPEQEPGVAHLTEHLLFQTYDAGRRPAPGRLAARAAALGAELSAWTAQDQTVLQVLLPSVSLDGGLALLAEALMHPDLGDDALARGRQAVLDEIAQAQDHPGRRATEALLGAAYRRHPYRRPLLGDRQSVARLGGQQVREFLRRHYGAQGLVLVAAGDFDSPALCRSIGHTLGGLPAGEQNRHDRPAEPQQDGLRVVAAEPPRKSRDLEVLLGFHIAATGTEDAAALDLASVILGHGAHSRLALEAQRNQRALRAASAYSFTPRDPGLLVVEASLEPGRLRAGAAALLTEVFRLRHEEVLGEELRRAQLQIELETTRQRETMQGLAREIGFYATVGGGWEAARRYQQRVRAMTPGALREVLGRYLVQEHLTVAVVGQQQAPPNREQDPERLLRAVAAQAAEQAAGRYAGVDQKSVRGPVVTRRLRGGPLLVVVQDRSVPLVAMHGVWRRGDEDERSAGLGVLLARLLVRGTRTSSGEQLAGEVAGLGGSLGGVAGPARVGLQIEALSAHAERALQVLADCVRHPAFGDGALEQERALLLGELRAREENLSQAAVQLFGRGLYPQHPFRLNPLGVATAVAGLSRRRLVEAYRRRYPLERLTLAVVGDVDPARIVALAETLFAPAAAGAGEEEEGGGRAAPEPAAVQDGALSEPVQLFRYTGRDQAHLVVGFRGAGVADQDGPALAVVSEVLESRLVRVLRDQRGLAYRVGAALDGPEAGYLAFYVATSPERAEPARAVIFDELRRIVDHEVEKDELQRAQRALISALELSRQRRLPLAAALAWHAALGQDYGAFADESRRIGRVSAADVARVARRYLDDRRAVLAAVLPESMTPGASRRSVRQAQQVPAPQQPMAQKETAKVARKGRR